MFFFSVQVLTNLSNQWNDMNICVFFGMKLHTSIRMCNEVLGIGDEMRMKWNDLNKCFFVKAFQVCIYIKSMKWSEWICVFFCGSFSRLYARIKMFFFSVYDLTNVIKSTKWSEWNLFFFLWKLFTFVRTHIDVLFLCLWSNKFIKSMKWNEYLRIFSDKTSHVHMYVYIKSMNVYRCSFSLFMI